STPRGQRCRVTLRRSRRGGTPLRPGASGDEIDQQGEGGLRPPIRNGLRAGVPVLGCLAHPGDLTCGDADSHAGDPFVPDSPLTFTTDRLRSICTSLESRAYAIAASVRDRHTGLRLSVAAMPPAAPSSSACLRSSTPSVPPPSRASPT